MGEEGADALILNSEEDTFEARERKSDDNNCCAAADALFISVCGIFLTYFQPRLHTALHNSGEPRVFPNADKKKRKQFPSVAGAPMLPETSIPSL